MSKAEFYQNELNKEREFTRAALIHNGRVYLGYDTTAYSKEFKTKTFGKNFQSHITVVDRKHKWKSKINKIKLREERFIERCLDQIY